MKLTSIIACGMLALIIVACGGAQEAPPATLDAEDSSAETTTDVVSDQSNSKPFEALPEPYNLADFQTGRRVFNQCKTCHTINDGGATLMGPNLYGVFDRQVGTLEGYSFSDALIEVDFVWTPDRLGAWLADPRGFLPGNRMVFSQIRREADRQALLAFIMLESGYAGTPE